LTVAAYLVWVHNNTSVGRRVVDNDRGNDLGLTIEDAGHHPVARHPDLCLEGERAIWLAYPAQFLS